MTKKTIEETYQKLEQREHILLRSGMYIGSTSKQSEELWVIDHNKKEPKMEKKIVKYTPGFIKIFDEILTNATDHSFRDPNVNQIKVNYDVKTGEISVWNNGSGIPIIEHKEHGIYIPELIFGHLLSGSNYDDTQNRTGAGTNGLGGKVCSIYSKKFVVETVDSERKLKFIQEYKNNMQDKSKPKITKCSSKSYTKITFIPDYSRFNMKDDCIEKDTVLLLNKRVYDCIAVTDKHVNIYLNDVKLKGKGLNDYMKFFFEDVEKSFIESHELTVNKTKFIWEYGIVQSEQFEQVSFVNGNSTLQGGTHVNNIMSQITNKYKKMLEDKKKLKELKPNFIKDKMFLFLRSTVVNPTFNSQTKEVLTTQTKDFGCNVQVSDKFIEKLYKSSITDEIAELSKMKENMLLAKTTDGSKKSKVYINNLDDANWAGTAKSEQCTLILTEGLSAKTFAMWGRSVVGPEKYGVFALKGKVINVRDASIQQLTNNEEINNIKQIMGLKHGKEYTDTKDLRYSKIMILTDADQDGSHIKGLLVNFIYYNWPSLLKIKPEFIQTLKTPIVKATKGKKVIEFFTEQDYLIWKNNTENTNSYSIKYFKGLGTSRKEDAQDTFKRLDELKVDYYYKDQACNDSLILAFEKDKNVTKVENVDVKKCSDKRKDWLSTYDKDIFIKMDENRVSYQDLINKELIHFYTYDNCRSIPSLIDGFKPSQRKIMYYMLKNNITKSEKVAQLASGVAKDTAYHHGEMSLNQAIVSMAQNFVGSNNINLLYPDGNMGSRLGCGKDAASTRYTFTRLEQETTRIFVNNDLQLLNYLDDDGKQIEPEYFVPIIPMILVNGCSGIGTGYSTSIPCYNPRDIIKNLKQLINKKPLFKLKPYYRDYNGTIEEISEGSFITKGKWEKISDTKIKITEIPVGIGVTTFKEFLESLIEKGSKTTSKKIILKDVEENTKDENTGIDFIIEFKTKQELADLIKNGLLEKELKLTKSFNTNNMYLFNERLVLKKYNTPNDILEHFFKVRLYFYQKRKEFMISKLNKELGVLDNKKRFITEYISGKIDINKKSKNTIIEILTKDKYLVVSGSYDYLLSIQIGNLSLEKIEELNKQIKSKKDELDYYMKNSKEDLWNHDLDDLLKVLKNEYN